MDPQIPKEGLWLNTLIQTLSKFALDATFFMDIRNYPKADQFMTDGGLEDKKFIYVIPRLQYTPYHQFNPNNNGWSDAKVQEVETVNALKKEED